MKKMIIAQKGICVDENAMCIYQSQNSNKERRESK